MEYMKKMAKTPQVGGRKNEPLTEQQIQSVEQQTGKPFPKAYREFLLLGGNGANMIADTNHEIHSLKEDDHYWKERQEDALRGMSVAGFSLQKDFWVFADMEGGEQFHFFYFDEGDDPPVYWYCSYHINDKGEDYAGVIDLKRSFTEHINKQIDVAKKYS